MHSGSIPNEFNELDAVKFKELSNRNIHISGTRDEYVTTDVIARENQKIEMLFGTECEIHRPDIEHEVDTALLIDISNTF